MKIVAIILLVIFCSPLNADAKECTDREIVNLKKIASNVNYSYEYYENNNKMYFDITFNNVYKDIYVLDLSSNKKYTKEEFVLLKKEDGQTLKFEIYAKNCNNELLSTKTLRLPTYNKYFKNPLCEDVHEYKYCSKWGKYSITEDELEKYIEEYKSKIDKPLEEEVVNYQTNIKGFYVFVALTLMTLLIMLISIIRVKRAKNII